MRLFLLLFVFAAFTSLSAQEFSGGFRAGLNFIAFDGDQEMSADGTLTFEEFNRTTGFHVGATFALAFTDLVGVKADLMYSQKGGERRFNGPSFFYLYSGPEDIEGTVNFENLEAEIDVVNSYIDIPVVGYYRIGILEIEGGASMGLLVNSRASGGLLYRDTRIARGDDIIFNIDGSNFSDEAGFTGILGRSETVLPGATQGLPSIVSAYYNNNSNEPLYRRLDFGLIAGISVFLNNGLYLGARYQHGLSDLTRPENDLRLTNETQIGGREFNEDDKDYSRSIQASVGFRF